MKTIFYKVCENKDDADYFFNNKPYIEWFAIENLLYTGSVSKYMVQKETRVIKSISVTEIKDEFSDAGITRRIALYITK